MAITEIPESKPGAPTDLTEKAESTPGNPTELTEEAESTPGNPSNLTELAESAPGVPSDLTEVAESNPAVPNNLVEVSESTPGNPSDLAEAAESTPGNPSDLTEVAEGSIAIPTNLTEIADSTPGNPSDLTEVAASDPGNPTALTLTTAKTLPRTITPRFNLSFGTNNYELNGVAKALSEIVTYSRASTASYLDRFRNQFGQYEYRIVEDYVGSVENLVTYSEQFNEWTGSNATVSANSITNPVTGKGDADKLIDNTANAIHTVAAASATVTSGATVNLSIRAKAGTLSKIGLYETQSADGVLFDLNSGLVADETGTPVQSSANYLSNGWYELSVTVTVPATAADFVIYLDSLSAYAGTNEFLYVIGAQLTESVKILPYVKTLSTAVTESFTALPRLEYSAATNSARGYLAEGESTNVYTYSEQFNRVDWTKTNASITTNQAISPDGSVSADELIEDATAAIDHRVSQGKTLIAAQDYTVSVMAKRKTRDRIGLRLGGAAFGGANNVVIFNLNTGTATITAGTPGVKIEDVGDGWYRCQMTANASAGGSSTVAIYLAEDDTGIAYDGDGVSSAYIWGAQLEAQSYGTSYIGTQSVSVTRNEDIMSFSFYEAPGTISVEASYTDDASAEDSNRAVFTIDDGTTSNRATIYNRLGDAFGAFGNNGGATQFSIAGDSTYIPDTFVKAVLTYKPDEVKLYRDSVLIDTDTSAVLPSFNTFRVGALSAGSSAYNGHIKSVSVYNKVLTAEEIAFL